MLVQKVCFHNQVSPVRALGSGAALSCTSRSLPPVLCVSEGVGQLSLSLGVTVPASESGRRRAWRTFTC